MRQRLRTALIIPALNEEPVLGAMLAAIPAGLFDTIVVADNGSTDRTAQVAERHGALVVREDERGYGAACLRALRFLPPSTEVTVFMQADLSENPAEAERLIAPIQDGCADLVIGCRTGAGVEKGALLPHQRFGNWVATTMIRVLYGYRYSDLGPFRAIRNDALLRLGMASRNYGWTVEMQVRALEEELRIKEVPVSYRTRLAGENKVSGNMRASIVAGVRILLTIARLWMRRAAKRETASN